MIISSTSSENLEKCVHSRDQGLKQALNSCDLWTLRQLRIQNRVWKDLKITQEQFYYAIKKQKIKRTPTPGAAAAAWDLTEEGFLVLIGLRWFSAGILVPLRPPVTWKLYMRDNVVSFLSSQCGSSVRRCIYFIETEFFRSAVLLVNHRKTFWSSWAAHKDNH